MEEIYDNLKKLVRDEDVRHSAFLLKVHNPEWSLRKCIAYANYEGKRKYPVFQTDFPELVMDNHRLEIEPEPESKIDFSWLIGLADEAIIWYNEETGKFPEVNQN